MKNLFDFATRELSQDAFLRWLLENYDDLELQDAAGDLLQEFCGIDMKEVKRVDTTAQWCNIDIAAWITLKDDRKAALFIEDKTYSEEHNQLDNYDNHIKWCENEYARIYKIFYKTDIISDNEKTRINNTKNTNKWRVYSIEEILPLFEKYINSGNLILRQFAEHVVNVYRATQNTQMPESNGSHIDYLKWISYFEKTVKPQLLEGYQDKCKFFVTKAGQYPYVYMSIEKSGYDKIVPKLEIRSRDCLPVSEQYPKRNINIRFLCYDMPETDVPQQQVLIEKIKQGGRFATKGMVQNRNGKEKYYPKQIGYLDHVTVKDESAFIQKIKEYIGYYLELMQDWK
ncbi:MAG TPA: hypothetical protein H9663_05220 [Firmicutes bacterium]|nr:hypothetical protein [Bacillota bacterium]